MARRRISFIRDYRYVRYVTADAELKNCKMRPPPQPTPLARRQSRRLRQS
jgi:hypothetical protein